MGQRKTEAFAFAPSLVELPLPYLLRPTRGRTPLAPAPALFGLQGMFYTVAENDGEGGAKTRASR